MAYLGSYIDKAVQSWAKDFAEENGLTDLPRLYWSVALFDREIRASPYNESSPSITSATIARWATALHLVHVPSTSHLDVGKIIYRGKVDQWKIQISAVTDKAANNRALIEYEANNAN
ncbi:hypothetical protein [Amycolatopsis sp. cmx-4-54]|uniref:hypothetical protein n=1 Tax=Amycolatopsis sp. cmx-4-54 TaxID=2790936 RepID=UPI00397E60DC